MSSKLDCPLCGRRLAPPDSPGLVTCDGCGVQFNPGMLVYRPAGPARRIVGGVMVALGVAAGARAVLAAVLLFGKLNGHVPGSVAGALIFGLPLRSVAILLFRNVDGDVLGHLVGASIFAAVLIVWGLTLARGRIVPEATGG